MVDLGVIVDHKLNWIEHSDISYVRNKVSNFDCFVIISILSLNLICSKLHVLAVKTCSPPPGLEPGSSDCQSDALPLSYRSETSFHRLYCAFIVSVSRHSPPDEPHVVSLVVKNLEQRIRNLHSGSVETIIANC